MVHYLILDYVFMDVLMNKQELMYTIFQLLMTVVQISGGSYVLMSLTILMNVIISSPIHIKYSVLTFIAVQLIFGWMKSCSLLQYLQVILDIM